MSESARLRDARGRFVPTRYREDGAVRCPLCGDWLPRSAFSWSAPRQKPEAYCKPCNAARVLAQTRARALRDPAWYATKMRRARDLERARNAGKPSRSVLAAQERLELARAALAFLLARGLYRREIAALAGVDRQTLANWAGGKVPMANPSTSGRVVRLMRCAWDVPPWKDRDRRKDKEHPFYAVLAVRMAESE